MKIKNILFPVDFSECSYALNPEVEWLAKRFHATVTLLHVFEIPVSWYGSGEAPLMSADCFKQVEADMQHRVNVYPLDLPDAQVNRVTAQGDISWHIKSWVEDHDTDLVMMGTHGYGVMRRLLLGSVAMKVLHDVNCPVWTHSPFKPLSNGVRISSILCPIEPNAEAVPLLRFVKDLAAEFGASVRLVHSLPDTDSRPYKYFDRDLHGFLMQTAREQMFQAQVEAGTDFPLTITEQSISKYIENDKNYGTADLIVLGRGRTQEVFGTLRTHTYDILRQAPCPVLSYCPHVEELPNLAVAKPAADQVIPA